MDTTEKTAKEIAQQYYLDDIITHEILLDVYHDLERFFRTRSYDWSISDIFHRWSKEAASHDLAVVFDIDIKSFQQVLRSEYSTEIRYLFDICQKK